MATDYWCHLKLTVPLLILNLQFGHTNATIDAIITVRCSISDEKMDCSRQKLTSVPSVNIPPNIISWDLSHNQIVTIQNGTFANMTQITTINLFNNKISQMELDCFLGLNNLKVLDISHNELVMPSSFKPGIFKPLQNLEILYMQATVNSNSYPDQALKDLNNLKKLYMQGTYQAFSPGFQESHRVGSIALESTKL